MTLTVRFRGTSRTGFQGEILHRRGRRKRRIRSSPKRDSSVVDGAAAATGSTKRQSTRGGSADHRLHRRSQSGSVVLQRQRQRLETEVTGR